MTTGEEAARSALKQSLEMNRVEVHLAEETIRILRHELRSVLEELERSRRVSHHPACQSCWFR